MKTKFAFIRCAALLLLLTTFNVQVSTTFAQGTAFTYQGRLNLGGTPANGTYDFVFTIFASASGINDSFANQTNSATSVSNGLFTVSLNLGDPSIFTGEDRWLEIEVRTNGAVGYVKLSPRQKITPAPYAITAGNVVSGGSGLANVNALTLGGIGSNGFWRATGNVGTSAGPNFLGTADNQPFEIQVNSTRALRIEPHGGAAPSLIGGYPQNTGSSYHGAVVAGGGTSGSINQALGTYAFVGAGHGGQAADYSAVVAGAYNVVPGQLSFIGSGERNTNQANYSVIGGGLNNFIALSGSNSFIGGGLRNSNLAPYTVVVGGVLNTASGAGGAFVGGGGNNLASDYNSVVSGGANNRALANATAIGGGSENTANNDHSTVGGGQANTASGPASTVAGGVNNSSSGDYATVGGGWQNTNSGYYTTIAGGVANIASGHAAAVGGGLENTSSGNYATVGAGLDNISSGGAATVSGGVYNQATNDYATVPGGENNLAGGQYSFAAGRRAKANHSGAFVWADSANADFVSSSNNQFLIRASGGVGIGTANPAAALHVDTARAGATDNTAAFNAPNLGPNVSHIHWGLKGDWYIRSAAGSGKVILQDSGGSVGIGTADPNAMLHVAGPVQFGSGTGTAESPDKPLIFRRVRSMGPTVGNVVARTDKLTLERDGTAGGWRIVNVASPGPTTIAATGLTLAGATVNFVTSLAGAASAGTNTVFTSAQNVVSFRCTFGDSYGPGELTEVSLTRYGSDYFWMGTVNSTFNQ
jgi:hypothetical protein